MVFIYAKENNIAAMDTKRERKALGKRIRVIRELKGLSQEELGEKASLSYKYLGELERGNVNVSFDSLLKISHALEIAVGDLFKKGTDESVIKVIVKEKSLFSKLSAEDLQTIRKSLALLNKVFVKN
jgi:transcriptional regulator with XRE-family HTH domain